MVKTEIQDIPAIFEKLSNVSSINEKKRILLLTKSDVLRYIFKQSYDPFINYGITKIDISDVLFDEKRTIDLIFLDSLTKLLYKLENRELTGNLARNEIKEFISHLPKKWAILVLNILKKDLRIGVSKKIINSTYNNLLPTDFCMSAMKYDKKRVFYPIYADTKLDGVRCIIDYNSKNKKVNLYSRNGRLFKNYSTIENEIKELDISSIRLDSEITMGHFQNLMRTISRKDDGIELAKDAVCNIFDVSLNNIMFNTRLEILNGIKKIIKEKNLKHLKVITGKKIESEKELFDFYEEQLKNGYEGIMVKPLNGLYEYKRSYSWMKMKPTETIDIKIIDVNEGTGKYKNHLGAFVCKLPNNENIQVGSGLDDNERKEYWSNKDQLIGQIIEVKFQEWTKNKQSIRFPVFLRFRPDK